MSTKDRLAQPSGEVRRRPTSVSGPAPESPAAIQDVCSSDVSDGSDSEQAPSLVDNITYHDGDTPAGTDPAAGSFLSAIAYHVSSFFWILSGGAFAYYGDFPGVIMAPLEAGVQPQFFLATCFGSILFTLSIMHMMFFESAPTPPPADGAKAGTKPGASTGERPPSTIARTGALDPGASTGERPPSTIARTGALGLCAAIVFALPAFWPVYGLLTGPLLACVALGAMHVLLYLSRLAPASWGL
ncbi:hypothetical protein H696_05117 [Fonticula alba]|uniref:Uncharacterized protein n=1 Tax=Fonticula alba TaxID=691883 RepID=A0A058Z2M2_FONAL|nr:hypothetical protein H696_05117 [Fonticula alba]KCV68188.1 hypothetical protein H696_05117 [Fonticula alba]|eukprot:XP_009497242.1 hypothetical protein H696_05117 [Fonticula alba]